MSVLKIADHDDSDSDSDSESNTNNEFFPIFKNSKLSVTSTSEKQVLTFWIPIIDCKICILIQKIGKSMTLINYVSRFLPIVFGLRAKKLMSKEYLEIRNKLLGYSPESNFITHPLHHFEIVSIIHGAIMEIDALCLILSSIHPVNTFNVLSLSGHVIYNKNTVFGFNVGCNNLAVIRTNTKDEVVFDSLFQPDTVY
jgi:hypothetical protein